MKEEFGSYFPLPLELKKRQNNKNDRLSCKENLHKITRRRIPFIPDNVRDVDIISKFMRFSFVIDTQMARVQRQRHFLCKRRHKIMLTLFTILRKWAELRVSRNALLRRWK